MSRALAGDVLKQGKATLPTSSVMIKEAVQMRERGSRLCTKENNSNEYTINTPIGHTREKRKEGKTKFN
jgi:hypothetical protein